MVSPLRIQFLLLHFPIINNNCGCPYVEIRHNRLLFHFLSPDIFLYFSFISVLSFSVRCQDPPNYSSRSLSLSHLCWFSVFVVDFRNYW